MDVMLFLMAATGIITPVMLGGHYCQLNMTHSMIGAEQQQPGMVVQHFGLKQAVRMKYNASLPIVKYFPKSSLNTDHSSDSKARINEV